MKRGQSGLAVVIGLGVIAVIMIIVAFAVKPGNTSTGRALYVPEEGLADEDPEFNNIVPYPFELRAWVITEEGVKLDIKNVGDEDYIIKILEIEGCGTENQNKLIQKGETHLLSVSCSLAKGADFESPFSFVYTPVPTGEAKIIRGKISDTV